MKPSELLDLAVKTSGAGSARTLAKTIDVDHSTLSLWASEQREIPYEYAMMLAQIAGLEPRKTADAVKSNVSKKPGVKKFLRELIKAAAVLPLLLIYTNGKCEDLQGYTMSHLTYCAHTIQRR